MELQTDIIHQISNGIVEQLEQQRITEPVYGVILTY